MAKDCREVSIVWHKKQKQVKSSRGFVSPPPTSSGQETKRPTGHLLGLNFGLDTKRIVDTRINEQKNFVKHKILVKST